MFWEFFCGCRRRTLFAWAGLVVFVGHQAFKAWLKYALNEWYQGFYDTLQTAPTELGSGDFDERLAEGKAKVTEHLLQFCVIVAPAIVVHPLAGLIRNLWVLEWRLTLMKSYLAHWDVTVVPVEGAAQRVHEDTQRFASGIQSCVAVVLDAWLTLMIFCPVLFRLMKTLLGVAGGFAVGGLLITFVVGRKLVGLEVQNQVVEAAIRRELVMLEVDPRSKVVVNNVLDVFRPYVRSLRKNYKSLYKNFAALAVWLATYEQVAVIVPYMVAAPLLFAADESRITLGLLVQISNAFGKVFDSFNTVADNWMSVNEWRSVLVRLREFERSHYQNGARARLHPSPHVVQMEMVPERPQSPPSIPPSAAPPLPYVLGDGACD